MAEGRAIGKETPEVSLVALVRLGKIRCYKEDVRCCTSFAFASRGNLPAKKAAEMAGYRGHVRLRGRQRYTDGMVSVHGSQASQPPLLLVMRMTPMQTSTVPAQRMGVTISPRKYWERKATST